MKSTAAFFTTFIFALFLLIGAPVALAEGDPLPPDSVIPDLQGSQDGIGNAQGRIEVYAEMADTDSQLREELEFLAQHGNAEAQAALDQMKQNKVVKSWLRRARKSPEGKADALKYGTDAVRYAVLNGAYWENPLFQAFLDKEKARRKKAMKEAAARQKAAEDENSVGMNGFTDDDLDAFAVSAGSDPDPSAALGGTGPAAGGVGAAAGSLTEPNFTGAMSSAIVGTPPTPEPRD